MDLHTGSPAHAALVGFGAGMMRAALDWLRPGLCWVWRRLWRHGAS